jgi:20S proteasome subunit alpha 5
VAVRTPYGVILGVEKRLTSPLLEQTSVEKVHELDAHVGVAVSGLTADARTLVDHARVECQSHRFTYDEPLRVESLAQSVCDLMMSFGEGGEENKSKMSRPFGVSLLLAGVDERGPQLFHADPSGTYVAYDAQAIGSGSEGARTLLQERYNKSMSLEEGGALVVRVLTETMEEKVSRGLQGHWRREV